MFNQNLRNFVEEGVFPTFWFVELLAKNLIIDKRVLRTTRNIQFQEILHFSGPPVYIQLYIQSRGQ